MENEDPLANFNPTETHEDPTSLATYDDFSPDITDDDNYLSTNQLSNQLSNQVLHDIIEEDSIKSSCESVQHDEMVSNYIEDVSSDELQPLPHDDVTMTSLNNYMK